MTTYPKIYPESVWLFWKADEKHGITSEMTDSKSIHLLYDNVFHKTFEGKTYVDRVKEDPDPYLSQNESLLMNKFNGYALTLEEQIILSHNILALSAAYPERYNNEYNGVMTVFSKKDAAQVNSTPNSNEPIPSDVYLADQKRRKDMKAHWKAVADRRKNKK